jgi:putative DNA primase/helicase
VTASLRRVDIEELETEVNQFRSELATVRSERDRLEAALEEREFKQEPKQEDRDEDQSPLDRAKQFVSFDH